MDTANIGTGSGSPRSAVLIREAHLVKFYGPVSQNYEAKRDPPELWDAGVPEVRGQAGPSGFWDAGVRGWRDPTRTY